MTKNNIFVLSLGGSLIAPPAGINWRFLKKFRTLILKQIKKGNRFIIVAGGGMTCRDYQNTALKVTKITRNNLDWIGLYTNRLHAQLMRAIFGKLSHPKIVESEKEKINFKEKVLASGGFRPGFSSDAVAILLAKKFKAKTILNLSNIDYVYNDDPKKFKNAEKITAINWKNFRKIVGNRWSPGLNTPFDPIASKKAEQSGLRVVILNGNKLKNLKKCLNGEKFKGTVIN